MSLLDPQSPSSNSNIWKYLTAALVVLLPLLAFIAWFALSPYLSVWNMQRAAENRDPETFSSYIDFPVLRENLKAELKAVMVANIAKDTTTNENPFSGLAAVLAPTMINNMVDSYVSSQAVEQLFISGAVKQQNSKIQNPATVLSPKNFGDNIESTGYENFNTFAITVKNENGTKSKLLFERRSIFWWQLANMKLNPHKYYGN